VARGGGSELHARRGRGDRGTRGGGYAKTTGLTSRARGQRESEGAGAHEETAAPTGGAGRSEREGGGCAEGGRADRSGPLRREREEGKARARNGPTGPKGRGGCGAGLLSSFLLFWNCFLFFFLFSLFDSNPKESQIQIRLSKNYAPNKSEI
jgi:hypothetical protein